MPNWKLHLEVGKRLSNKLKLNKEQEELFMIGNILPDINNGYLVRGVSKVISHTITHYVREDFNNHLNFYEKNKDKFNNYLVLGYFSHLYTDYIWNDDYYSNLYNDEKLKNMSSEELRYLKQSDFRVYDNKYLNNKLELNDLDNILNNSKEINSISIDKNDLIKAMNYINNRKKYDKEFKYYNIKYLDNLLDKTIEEIYNFIKNLKK